MSPLPLGQMNLYRFSFACLSTVLLLEGRDLQAPPVRAEEDVSYFRRVIFRVLSNMSKARPQRRLKTSLYQKPVNASWSPTS